MATKEVFVCNAEGCGRTFKTSMALIGHMGYHSNQGEYRCEICSLENGMSVFFTLPQGLGAHLRAKHNIIGSGEEKEAQITKAVDRIKAQRALASEEALVVPSLKPPPPPSPGPPPLATAIDIPVAEQNGSVPIEKEIQDAFAPLILRYNHLQARQQELNVESERIASDLSELWSVLGAVGDKVGVLPPPPGFAGVQVAFQKKVSDSLKERGEEWLSNRRNSFTASDMARGLGVVDSTAVNLIVELRDEAKLRLVGKRGRAKTYQSMIGAR